MSDKPVWMEEWQVCGGTGSRVEHVDTTATVARVEDAEMLAPIVIWPGKLATEGTIRLGAAAPALVRALLLAEAPLGYDGEPHCGGCSLTGDIDARTLHSARDTHGQACPVDAALTAAGFPTRESRDAARERMRRG